MAGLHDLRKLHIKHTNTSDKVYSVKHFYRTWVYIFRYCYAYGQKDQEQDTDFRIAKLFKDNENDIRIEKVRDYRSKKYNTATTEISAFFTNNGPANGSSHWHFI